MRLENTGIRLVHIAGHNIGPGKTTPNIPDREFRRGERGFSLHRLIEESPVVMAGIVKILRDESIGERSRVPPPPPAPPVLPQPAEPPPQPKP